MSLLTDRLLLRRTLLLVQRARSRYALRARAVFTCSRAELLGDRFELRQPALDLGNQAARLQVRRAELVRMLGHRDHQLLERRLSLALEGRESVRAESAELGFERGDLSVELLAFCAQRAELLVDHLTSARFGLRKTLRELRFGA